MEFLNDWSDSHALMGQQEYGERVRRNTEGGRGYIIAVSAHNSSASDRLYRY